MVITDGIEFVDERRVIRKVGGAGNTMLVDSKDRTAKLPQTQEPVYRNGVWRYETGRDRNAIVSSSENTIVHSVSLHQDEDVLYLRVQRQDALLAVWLSLYGIEHLTLERNGATKMINGVYHILSTQGITHSRVERSKLAGDLGNIQNLELKLRKEIGNYRGSK